MALLYEAIDQPEKALQRWELIQTKEGSVRTIAILKKAGLKDWIKQYGVWVLKSNPELFLSLFKKDPATQRQEENLDPFVGSTVRQNAIMSIDEVLDFLTPI